MTLPGPLYPPALRPGDTIGIVALSSHFPREKTDEAEAFLRQQGFNVVFHPQTEKRHGQFAGTPQDKLAALHDYIRNPAIHAIFSMVGGNGAIHLLDGIDYGLIADHPKILLGFSDATVLLNAVTARTGLVTFHGPTLSRFAHIGQGARQCVDMLTGQSAALDWPALRFLRGGSMQGPLIGGNLSMAQTLIGTDYLPSPDGAILLIEDINDHLSRYDRMIGHFRQAGILSRLNGIVIGQFLNSQDNPDRPFGFSIEDIVLAHTEKTGTPLATGAPVGHGAELWTLPLGAQIRIEGAKATLPHAPVRLQR